MMKASKYISGVLAIGVYALLMGLLVFYFNTRSEEKSKHYVKKDEHRIQVALSAPTKFEKSKAVKQKPKAKPKPKLKKKPKAKSKVKPESKKVIKKKRIKEKIIKKKKHIKKDVNKTKRKKKNNAKNLFANVKTPKKKDPVKVSKKPIKKKPIKKKPAKRKVKKSAIQVNHAAKSASERINASLKVQKSADSGVENAYLAKVQRMLEGWPAQSDYVGEKVKVMLYIDPGGSFEFKLKTASSNQNFNEGLTEYLKQLQEFGFGRHKGGRTYQFEAEFIAKE